MDHHMLNNVQLMRAVQPGTVFNTLLLDELASMFLMMIRETCAFFLLIINKTQCLQKFENIGSVI